MTRIYPVISLAAPGHQCTRCGADMSPHAATHTLVYSSGGEDEGLTACLWGVMLEIDAELQRRTQSEIRQAARYLERGRFDAYGNPHQYDAGGRRL